MAPYDSMNEAGRTNDLNRATPKPGQGSCRQKRQAGKRRRVIKGRKVQVIVNWDELGGEKKRMTKAGKAA